MGSVWSTRGSSELEQYPLHKCYPRILRGLPVCFEEGGTIETAMSCRLIGFRLRAAATSSHDAEQLGRQQADLLCVRKNDCVIVYVSTSIFVMSDSTGLLEFPT